MARTCFLILLLINLLLLGWIFISGDSRINAGREPQRALTQLVPEKVRILNEQEASPTQCRAFVAPLGASQDIAKIFAGALPLARIVVTPMPLTTSYEVVIAGLKKRSQAESSLAEMKSLGLVSTGEIRADGENAFTIAIATFEDRASAELALRNLEARGLRLASIAERQTGEARATIEVRGNEPALHRLPELAARFKTLATAPCAS